MELINGNVVREIYHRSKGVSMVITVNGCTFSEYEFTFADGIKGCTYVDTNIGSTSSIVLEDIKKYCGGIPNMLTIYDDEVFFGNISHLKINDMPEDEFIKYNDFVFLEVVDLTMLDLFENINDDNKDENLIIYLYKHDNIFDESGDLKLSEYKKNKVNIENKYFSDIHETVFINEHGIREI